MHSVKSIKDLNELNSPPQEQIIAMQIRLNKLLNLYLSNYFFGKVSFGSITRNYFSDTLPWYINPQALTSQLFDPRVELSLPYCDSVPPIKIPEFQYEGLSLD